MKKLLILLVCLYLSQNSFCQQGISNIWLQGYDSNFGGPPGGINHIDFISGTPVISYDSLGMEFNHTHANISDSTGNLLFYTNGVYIADATNDTMQNGGGINPGAYSNFVPDGHLIPQGALIIKKPGWNSLYYMFHSSADNYPSTNGSVAYYLSLSVIDMSLNNGLGAVILKNQHIISDTLNTGKIHAVKHANGRDWWVVCHRVNSNKYYKLLVTPNGLPTVYSQNVGSFRQWDAGNAKFSPDGSLYAYYHYSNGLDIYYFDRCSGAYFAIAHDTLPVIGGNVGLEFSANSQFLYISNILKVYQYEVTAGNILATKMEVAVWDSFYQPGIPGLGAYFCYPQLAPDGKIYITTGNSTTYMHRINNPDLPGLACDVEQHGVLLPAYYFNTLPNHPNYFLGKISGSPCDTVVDVGIDEPGDITVGIYPNPTNGNFMLSFPVQHVAGDIEVYDVNGKLVHRDYVAPWSQYKKVDISNFTNGIYMCRMRWPSSAKASEDKVKSVRVLINE
jgi:hypothetical protein